MSSETGAMEHHGLGLSVFFYSRERINRLLADQVNIFNYYLVAT
jgi:hypothetical protein